MSQREHLIKPMLFGEYPTVEYGKGAYLYDIKGKKYLDGSSGAVTASIGHGVEEITKAMVEQANKVSFVYRAQFTSKPAEKLAEKLAELTPGDLNWTFFVNSGSEATETALKIAIQHWQEKGIYTKKKILSRWMSYHGITLGALSMSGHVARRKRFTSLLNDTPDIPAPYCKHCPYCTKRSSCHLECAEELERAILRHGQENIAAFIAEPIIGAAGGSIVPPPGYYEKIKQICEKYNILFIADEVMTGLGRTGKMFGFEHWDAVPDIIALGKGMSAGYTPMAATIVSDQVMKPIADGSSSVMSGHTYSANPLSAAVSLAVLEYGEKHNIVQNSRYQGEKILTALKDLQPDYPMMADVRGKGLMIGVELNSEYFFDEKEDMVQKVVAAGMKYGLLLYPANAGEEGISGGAVMITPPLTITDEEVDDLLEKFTQTMDELKHEKTIILNSQG